MVDSDMCVLPVIPCVSAAVPCERRAGLRRNRARRVNPCGGYASWRRSRWVPARATSGESTDALRAPTVAPARRVRLPAPPLDVAEDAVKAVAGSALGPARGVRPSGRVGGAGWGCVTAAGAAFGVLFGAAGCGT